MRGSGNRRKTDFSDVLDGVSYSGNRLNFESTKRSGIVVLDIAPMPMPF
jgi:hypothetical protein